MVDTHTIPRPLADLPTVVIGNFILTQAAGWMVDGLTQNNLFGQFLFHTKSKKNAYIREVVTSSLKVGR